MIRRWRAENWNLDSSPTQEERSLNLFKNPCPIKKFNLYSYWEIEVELSWRVNIQDFLQVFQGSGIGKIEDNLTSADLLSYTTTIKFCRRLVQTGDRFLVSSWRVFRKSAQENFFNVQNKTFSDSIWQLTEWFPLPDVPGTNIMVHRTNWTN